MSSKSDLLKILYERGFIHQCTDIEQLDALALTESVCGYIGFDCTAKSLHVGSLVSIMLLRTMQKTGHMPIILLGGGTTKIGDPSGKDESRKMLTYEQIQDNKTDISSVFSKFIELDKAIVADNDEWLKEVLYIDFLRDYGKHFSVNRMLTMDSVKLRLEREQNLSFLEFNYMLLQSYDFIELHKRYGCRLQCGGSDQWGNIVSGVELGRRMQCKELYGLTTPLITTHSGAKMGKTASGAVWLSDDMLSPYEYWQFWRNTHDNDVIRFLKLFTELPISEISKLSSLQGEDINEAKKILANEATSLCHGKEEAEKAAKAAAELFELHTSDDGLPTHYLDPAQLEEGIPVFKMFLMTGMVESGAEARRLIKSGGAKINDTTLLDELEKITRHNFKEGKLRLSVGKKHHVLVKLKNI